MFVSPDPAEPNPEHAVSVCGHLAPVHWCALLVRCVVCAVSWATLLPFTCVPARCVASRVGCPAPLGSCSPVCLPSVLCCGCSVSGHLHPFSPPCSLGALCCVSGVLCHLAPVHWCARSVRCLACAVSWATWLLFNGVLARCVVLPVRCPGPLGSCSPVCWPTVLCCVYGVLSHLAPVHWCARSVQCAVCVQCPWPLGSRTPLCPPGVLCPVCGDLGHLTPVHWCARSVCCVPCAASYNRHTRGARHDSYGWPWIPRPHMNTCSPSQAACRRTRTLTKNAR